MPTSADFSTGTAPAAALYARLGRRSIPALDGVRALSVTAVILHHTGVQGDLGARGVMAFFILSGFLITWLLLDEQEQSGSISLRGFYIRRALRIFPAFYVFWAAYVALAVFVQGRHEWAQYFSSFFYVSNYYSAIVQPRHMAIAHSWSLAVEEQFYLLWPWIFVRFGRDRRRLARGLAVAIGALAVYRPLLYFAVKPGLVWMTCSFDTHADHLALGCLIAVLLRIRAGERSFTRLCGNAATPAATLALLAAVVALSNRHSTFRFALGSTAESLLVGVLIVQWVALSGRPAWSWLDSRPLRYFGRVSYAAYLYHWFASYVMVNRFAGSPMAVKLGAATVITLLLATASYYLVERPFLLLKDRFSYRTRESVRHVLVGGQRS